MTPTEIAIIAAIPTLAAAIVSVIVALKSNGKANGAVASVANHIGWHANPNSETFEERTHPE
jgi:hypothetical protein